MHPNFPAMAALLDGSIARLVLQPTQEDVHADTVAVLLLYAQWMTPSEAFPAPGRQWKPKLRYNDISAFTILGLTVRLANLIGLNRSCRALLRDPDQALSCTLSDRVRLWYNLLSCDCNLVMTSGLHSSFNAALIDEAAAASECFASHTFAQLPGDARLAGLIQLVSIVSGLNARSHTSQQQPHEFDATQLQKINVEMDEWERQVLAG